MKAIIDKGGVVGAVLLDLKKAFHNVAYVVLLAKFCYVEILP